MSNYATYSIFTYSTATGLETETFLNRDFQYEYDGTKCFETWKEEELPEMSTFLQYIEKLEICIPRYSFLRDYSPMFYEKGFLFLPPIVLNETEALRFLFQFHHILRKQSSSLLNDTKDWIQQTLFAYYFHIFSQSVSWRTKSQCACFLFRHTQYFPTNQDRWDFGSLLMDMMEEHYDWELFDVCQRHESEFSPQLRQRLWSFYETYRFERRRQRPEDTTMDDFDLVDHDTNPMNHEMGIEERTETIDRSTQIPQVSTIFENKQNVHDPSIQQSVQDSWLRVMKKYPSSSGSPRISSLEIEQLFQHHSSISFTTLEWNCFQQVLTRVYTDPSSFFIHSTSVQLCDLVHVLYQWYSSFSDDPDRQYEILQRWKEEWMECVGTCFSGHVSRFLNIMSGLEEDVQLQISPKEQLKIYWNQWFLSQQHVLSESIVMDMIYPNPFGVFHQWMLEHSISLLSFLKERDSEDSTTKPFHPNFLRICQEIWIEMFPSLASTLSPIHYGTISLRFGRVGKMCIYWLYPLFSFCSRWFVSI